MNTQRQLLLGIFFIVALSLLAYYTLFLTDVNLFKEPVLMRVYFPDANNLREGDQVQLLGARIGRVREITPNLTATDPRKRILTVLNLDRKIELLEGAQVMIRETSLLGGRHVFIDPGPFGGTPLEPLEDGAFLGQIYKNPITMLGDIGTLFNENRAAITESFLNIRDITKNVKDGTGLIGRLVVDKELADDARAAVGDARTVMANVRSASEQLQSGQGLIGALLYDDATKTKFTEIVDNLQKISADLANEQGLLGALVHDQALKDRVTTGIDSFVSFARKLDQAEGALGLLMSDPTTREEVRTLIANFSRSSADIQSIVADMRDGKGTLGKLLTDEGLHEDLRKAVAVLARTLEDYREAAPITSFTSVLFAAF